MASAADQMAQSISLAKFAQATDLKKRLWFTIGALIVFRLLSYVPLPGVDPTGLAALANRARGGVLVGAQGAQRLDHRRALRGELRQREGAEVEGARPAPGALGLARRQQDQHPCPFMRETTPRGRDHA